MASSHKTINEELQRLALPETIRATASEIYAQVAKDTGTRRCLVRRSLIFFCVYNAYLENGWILDPIEISKIVGINPSMRGHALKQFSAPRTSYRIKSITTHPVDLIDSYARQLGIRHDLIPEIQSLCRKWTSDPTFEKLMPQPVAAGAIRYYMEIHGLSVDIQLFLNTFNLTRLALDSAYHKISQLDNA